jgi:hypothetical protein
LPAGLRGSGLARDAPRYVFPERVRFDPVKAGIGQPTDIGPVLPGGVDAQVKSA